MLADVQIRGSFSDLLQQVDGEVYTVKGILQPVYHIDVAFSMDRDERAGCYYCIPRVALCTQTE